ncbi:DUF4832 domain-containing protein [Mucilaginibacter gotjawali]|uniref:Uncharacterized protein n=2 Tax=Mucilaginibacter gotjawali TaxID=1550579 RepID=A0A839SNA9_9SPHI|nr:DUF4832 domain-containing protein [Mucilaginibacter gotjawali]MBB3058330.1 hypothetical protein [Mucilaginibacter gotjawali]BAU55550.1 hypothetical protein MgSA37_03740 [Mucilaginibacter gotjawali]
MKNSIIVAALLFALSSCSKKETVVKTPVDTSAIVTYTESSQDIVNPERGFFQYAEIHASNYIPLSASLLAGYRGNQSIPGATYTVACSLVYVEYVLDSFVTSPISADFLTKFDQDCATARSAGVKLIPRFIYTNTTHGGTCPEQSICTPYGDATKAVILNHISQLKPYLQKDADVIACMQLGFIGIWGENYYTDNFGDASSNGQGKLLDNNWQDRIDVLKALLAALPADRMVQVRIPQLKERYVYGINANVNSAAMTDAEAFTETDKARIGFHNDCFLSGTNDEGTYFDYGNSSTPEADATTALRNFEKYDTKYVAVGGETCTNGYTPQNECEPTGIAKSEFERFHYSFLNAVYNLDLNNNWVTGGCMDSIKQKLGYRFVLRKAEFPTSASASGNISVNLTIANIGYASPYNPRPVQLILRNQTSGNVFVAAFKTDIRKWYTGTINLQQTLALPAGITAGNYDVLLNMPDNAPTLNTNPNFSIQLANNNTWESNTGYNKLQGVIAIK